MLQTMNTQEGEEEELVVLNQTIHQLTNTMTDIQEKIGEMERRKGELETLAFNRQMERKWLSLQMTLFSQTNWIWSQQELAILDQQLTTNSNLTLSDKQQVAGQLLKWKSKQPLWTLMALSRTDLFTRIQWMDWQTEDQETIRIGLSYHDHV